MVIISLELTRVNPGRNIFSINVELTSTFLLYRGLVHHRILNSFNSTLECSSPLFSGKMSHLIHVETHGVLAGGVERPEFRNQLGGVVSAILSNNTWQLAERVGESLHGV